MNELLIVQVPNARGEHAAAGGAPIYSALAANGHAGRIAVTAASNEPQSE